MSERRIIVLSWHPADKDIAAGGFRRLVEIMRRYRGKKQDVIFVDRKPSLVKGLNVDRVDYDMPRWVESLTKRSFGVGRAIEWFLASSVLIATAIRLRKKYDVIYIPYSELLAVSWPGYFMKVFFRKEVVMMNQNAADTRFKRFWTVMFQNAADRFMTLTPDLAKSLVAEGNRRDILLNSCGLDREMIATFPPVKKFKHYDTMFVGRHTESKGLYDYVELLAEVLKTKPDFQFATVGFCTDEMRADLGARLKEKGIADHWDFLGILTEAEKYGLMKRVPISWFLSTQEGWGLVPQEAMACDQTPICYDLPVYKHSIRDCSAAKFVPIEDWSAAAKATFEIMSWTSAERKKQNKIGHRHIAAYDWQIIADREFALIRGAAE